MFELVKHFSIIPFSINIMKTSHLRILKKLHQNNLSSFFFLKYPHIYSVHICINFEAIKGRLVTSSSSCAYFSGENILSLLGGKYLNHLLHYW